MRIADILLPDDDGGLISMDGDKGWGGTGCVGGADFFSPRRLIGRWLKRLRLREKKIGKAKEGVESGDGSVPTRCSTNCPTSGIGDELSSGFKESSDGSGPSGSCRKETSFNLGVGASLLYLIANTKNELNKMTELRAQMENFLQVSKEELQREDAFSKLSETHNNVACSTTDIPEGSNSNSNLSVQFSTASYPIPESEITLEYDQSSRLDSPIPGYSAEGMDQLEEELEAELERLQLHLETETLLEHPQEAGAEEHNGGVHPYVLERRLHELLESRQQDHIEELEAALKCFQQKLREKEYELSWWKETARLISQHIPGTPHLACSP